MVLRPYSERYPCASLLSKVPLCEHCDQGPGTRAARKRGQRTEEPACWVETWDGLIEGSSGQRRLRDSILGGAREHGWDHCGTQNGAPTRGWGEGAAPCWDRITVFLRFLRLQGKAPLRVLHGTVLLPIFSSKDNSSPIALSPADSPSTGFLATLWWATTCSPKYLQGPSLPSKQKNSGPTARTGESQVLRQKCLGKCKRLHDGGEPPGQEIMSPKLWELTSCDRWLTSTILSGSEMVFRPNILKCNGILTCRLNSYDVGAVQFSKCFLMHHFIGSEEVTEQVPCPFHRWITEAQKS